AVAALASLPTAWRVSPRQDGPRLSRVQQMMIAGRRSGVAQSLRLARISPFASGGGGRDIDRGAQATYPFVEGQMPLQRVHSFLVHPAKHDEEPPEVRGTSIHRRGQTSLYEMLNGVFTRAPEECDIDIVFRRNDDGQQQNDCRDLLVAYAEDPSMPNGRVIAQRLQAVTTHRSGLGLFFLMKGQQDDVHTLVVARFPA